VLLVDRLNELLFELILCLLLDLWDLDKELSDLVSVKAFEDVGLLHEVKLLRFGTLLLQIVEVVYSVGLAGEVACTLSDFGQLCHPARLVLDGFVGCSIDG